MPQVVGEADLVEEREQRRKPGQGKHPKQHDYRKGSPAAPGASPPQTPESVPVAGSQRPRSATSDVEPRQNCYRVHPPDQPLHIAHVMHLAVVEQRPLLPVDAGADVQRFLQRVEVVAEPGPHPPEVVFLNTGVGGYVVLLKAPVVHAWIVERPRNAGADQEHGHAQHEQPPGYKRWHVPWSARHRRSKVSPAPLRSNSRPAYNRSMTNNNAPEIDMTTFQSLLAIVERLRAPGGCPWDREQTHASLKRNLLEECYEVLEAIDGNDPQALAEELGDILVQVAFHADIARENGEFSVDEVLTHINEKLVRRHPHVFAEETASDAREVERNWERIKEAERKSQGGHRSVVEGIPRDLPALTYAQLLQDRVGRAGFEWDDISGVLDKLVEEVEELRRASNQEERVHELGDVMFTIVNLSRWMEVHAEDALRQANSRFQRRYMSMETLAAQRGLDFDSLPLMQKEALWQEAKQLETSTEG